MKKKQTAEQAVKQLETALKNRIAAKGYAEFNHAMVAEQEAWKKFHYYLTKRVDS